MAEQKAQLKILREQVALLQAHEMEEHGGHGKSIFFLPPGVRGGSRRLA